jgi:STE24 endopeptidase
MKLTRAILVLLFAVSWLCVMAPAQPNPAATPTAMQAADATGSPQSVVVPQDTILEYAPPPAQYARAKAYSLTHYRHFFINSFYGFLVLLVLLRWRIGPMFRDLAERVSSRRSVQVIIFAPLTLLAIAILGLPSDMWDQSLQRAYGLSVQTWGPWLTDWITSQLIVMIVGAILVAILYAVIRRSPRRWWFYFWLASIPVLLVMFFLQPLVIDPLFFTFKPLAGAQPVLVSEMQKVMQRGGIAIPEERMYVMNASSKETGLNAYVAGFGASKRVVVWDNTLAKATVPETLFVFGHEMGHYVLLHIPKEIAINAIFILFLLYLGFQLAHWMLDRYGARWGIRSLDDWASFPMLFFLIGVLAFFASPVLNGVSRYFEHEADRYGIEVIHGIVPNENQVAAHYFQKSGEMNLSDPDPNWFTKAWFFDHPTRPERVHFVATYKPWAKGEEPVYVK